MPAMRAKIVDGLIWGLGGRVALLGVNFITLVVTARILTPADFGVYAVGQIFIDLGYAVANSTFGTPLIRAQGLSQQEERFGFAAFFGLAISFSVVLGVFRGTFALIFNQPLLGDVIGIVALIMPLRIISGYYTSMMLYRMSFRWYQISQTVPQVLGSIATIVLALKGFGIWSLVAGFGLASGLEFFIALCKSQAESRFPNSLSPLSTFWKIGSGTLAARGADLIATNVDKVTIAQFVDASSLGLYTRSFALVLIPFKVIALVASRIFLSAFAKLENESARSSVLAKILSAQAALYIPMTGALVMSSEPLVRITLGDQWIQSVPICEILFLSLFSRLGYEVINNAFTAVGDVWPIFRRIMFSIPVYLVLCPLGYWQLGIHGVALAVSSTIVFFYFVSILQVCQKFGCSFYAIIKAHLVAFGLTLAAVAVAWAVPHYFPAPIQGTLAATLYRPIAFTFSILTAWACAPKLFWGYSWASIRNR